MSGHDFDVITTEDVDWLNGRLIARSANVTRIAGTVLAAVGAVGVVLALWVQWRYQDELSSVSTDLGSPLDLDTERDVTWQDRLDGFARLYNLVLPVMAIAMGLVLRLVADYVVARTGGSVGTVAVGDPVPGGPDDDEEAEDADSAPAPVLPPDPGGYEPRA